MSTIGVKYHNEDIHNIIRKPMSPTIKSPRYKSKRTMLVDLALIEKNKYNGHQTFGLAHYKAPEAKNYLRRGKPRVLPSAVKSLSGKEVKCTISCALDNQKLRIKNSLIPKPSHESKKPLRKNYVKENIRKVVALEPKVPVPRRVETPKGTSKDMTHLIQMIKIRQSEEYGRIPKYLEERKKKEEKQRRKREKEIRALIEYREKMGIGTMGMGENVYMVDQETRQKILDGLKENWNELSKQFLKLPVMTDTWPKIKKKMWLEKEIDQLEKDIKLVESHPYIYLERHDKDHEKEMLENLMQSKMKKQEEEAEVKEEKEEKVEMPKVKEKETVKQQPEEEALEEEIAEEKKEEDKEINILNY